MTSYKILEGNWWIEATREAKLASPGVTESFLKASHVMRTCHARAVTACSLHIAWIIQLPLSQLPKWCRHYLQHLVCPEESPQFLYWCICLELEILVFTFVRYLRIGGLYVESLTKLTRWFFSHNHTNYARWMPIHVRDTCSLDVTHPQVAHSEMVNL